MKFFYITNDVAVAQVAEKSGVDRIFVDLEYIGKEERQKNLDTVKSKHSLADIKKIKTSVDAELLVRVNPMHKESKYEIEKAIDNGADYIMLPMFKNSKEVKEFLEYVNGKCKTILLFEHIEAVNNADAILELIGIDEVYIGLNDLHLSMNLTFMFELLQMPIIADLCKKFAEKKLPYGIGGVATLGQGLVPAEYIFTELYNLGATSTILSRSFMPNEELLNVAMFKERVGQLRELEENLKLKDKNYFEENKKQLGDLVRKVVNSKEN